MKKIFLFIFWASSAFAYTNLGVVSWGDPVYSPSAKPVSLGLTAFSASSGADVVFNNPAKMSGFENVRVFASLPFAFTKERIVPDSDWSADTGGATYNENFYFDLPSFAVVVPFSPAIKVGAGFADVIDFNYDHTKAVYSGETYQGNIDWESEGHLKGYNLAFSFPFFRNWKASLAWEILRGSKDVKDSSTISATSEKEEWDFSGSRLKYGFYKDKGLWNLSVNYFTSASLDYDYAYSSGGSSPIKSSGDMDLPKKVALGFNYIWAGAVSASFYFDAVKTYWSQLDENFEDRISFHTGIENDISARIKLRYGMAFIPSWEESSVERVALTFGVGYYLSAVTSLDIGFAYCKRDYLYNWDGTEGNTYSGRVDENLNLLNVSLDMKF